MSDNITTQPKPAKIGKRQIRAKQIAVAVIEAAEQGKTMAEVGAELYPTAKYPSQTLSNSVRYPGPQAELRAWVNPITEEKLAGKLNEHIDSESKGISLKATEIGLKYKGLLIDKQDQTRRNLAPVQDLSEVDTGKLADELMSRLRLSAQGIEPDTKAG